MAERINKIDDLIETIFFSYPTLNERVLLSSLTSKTSGDWFKKKKTK